jgi:hypothetical protein
MPAFVVTGKKIAGNTFTVNGGAANVLPTDTLTINGVKQTVLEWIRRGRIRQVSVAGFVTTYHVLSSPEKEGGI